MNRSNVTHNLRNSPGPKVPPVIRGSNESRPLPLISRTDRFFGIHMGIVIDVDDENYTAQIEWVYPNSGSRSSAKISFPSSVGPRGQIGTLPEKGAYIIAALVTTGSGSVQPIIIGYLPAQQELAFNFGGLQEIPDSSQPKNCIDNKSRYKMRKLKYGDMLMSSPFGADFLLNNNVSIKSPKQAEIMLKDSEQAFMVTALNGGMYFDGASVSAGQIIRDNADLLLNNIREKTLVDGTKIRLIVPQYKNEQNSKLETESNKIVLPYYTEYRVTVDEMGAGQLDRNSRNSGVEASSRKPAITLAMGNYVGHNYADEGKIYGRMLKMILFNSRNDLDGHFQFMECKQLPNDEVDSLGLIYMLHSHKSGSMMGMDKDGHWYEVLKASSSRNSLGRGRSKSVLADGNLKEVWGKDDDGNSMDITGKGGMRVNLGAHNGSSDNGTSLHVTASKGIAINVVNPSQDGTAKFEELNGNAYEHVTGHKTITVEKNLTISCEGTWTNKFLGSHEEHYGSDKATEVNGTSSEIVMKDKQLTCLTRKITIINPPISPQGPMKLVADEKTVNFGNIKESITVKGDKLTNLTLGDIKESIKAGNRITNIIAGDYKVSILTKGNVNMKTNLGNINLSCKKNVSITGTLGIKATSTASIKMSAPKVTLGTGPAMGVVTMASHLDYVMGIPLKGSATVSATM